MALVKPKRRPAVVATKIAPPRPAKIKPRTTAAYKPATVTQPNRPAAVTPAAVPPTPVATPPVMPSIQTTADRNATRYDYGNTMGDVNSQLRNLAQNYGGAPGVLQFGYGADANGAYADTTSTAGVTPNAPGSQLEVLLRNLTAQKRNVNETANADNTFFSSRRVGDLGLADAGYSGDVAQAQRDYEAAIARLTSMITGAQGTRNQNLTQADINDWQAAQQAPPEAQAVDPGPVDWGAVGQAFGTGPYDMNGNINVDWSKATWQTAPPKKPKKK